MEGMRIRDESGQVDSVADHTLEELTDMFPAEDSAVMRDKCWDGLRLDVARSSERNGEFFFREQEHIFDVKLELAQPLRSEPPSTWRRRLTNVFGNEDATAKTAGNRTSNNTMGEHGVQRPDIFLDVVVPVNRVWIRLLLCDASGVGFCTPFVATDNGENSAKQQALHVATDHIPIELEPRLELARDDDGAVELVVVTDVLDVGTNDTNNATNATEPPIDYVTQSAETTISINLKSDPERPATSYFIIGHAIFFSSSFNSTALVSQRVDMAASIPGNVLVFREPPTTQQINDGFRYTMVALIAIGVMFQLFLFYQVQYHRKTTVMRLSQAPFLATFVVMGTIATGCSYFIIPTNDTTCNLRDFFILTPLTAMGAITIGRLWRINSVLSPALRIGGTSRHVKEDAKKTQNFMCFLDLLSDWGTIFCLSMCFPSCRQDSITRAQTTSLRKPVTSQQLWKVLVVLTLPQFIFQCIKARHFPETYGLEMNDSGTEGRYQCVRDSTWPLVVGYCIVGVMFALSVYVAHLSRELPSLFNETKDIFKAAWIVCIVLCLGIPMFALTQQPSVTPAIQVFVFMAIVFSLVFSTSYLLVLKKLRLIWNKEQVVVSNLLRGTKNVDNDSETSANELYERKRLKQHRRQNDIASSEVWETQTDSADESYRNTGIESRRASLRGRRSLLPPPHRVSFYNGSYDLGGSDDDGNGESDNKVVKEPVCDDMDLELGEIKPRPDDKSPERTPMPAPVEETPSSKVLSGAPEGINGDIGTTKMAEESGEVVRRSSALRAPRHTNSKQGHGTGRRRSSLAGNERTLAGVRVRGRPRRRQGQKHSHPIYIKKKEPVPRKLENQMYVTKDIINRITNRLMTGMQVPKDDWEKLRTVGAHFGERCERLVFEWDSDDEQN